MTLTLVVDNTKTEGNPLYCFAEEMSECWSDGAEKHYVLEYYTSRIHRRVYQDIASLAEGIRTAKKKTELTLTHRVNPDYRSMDYANCDGPVVWFIRHGIKRTYRPLDARERLDLNITASSCQGTP